MCVCVCMCAAFPGVATPRVSGEQPGRMDGTQPQSRRGLVLHAGQPCGRPGCCPGLFLFIIKATLVKNRYRPQGEEGPFRQRGPWRMEEPALEGCEASVHQQPSSAFISAPQAFPSSSPSVLWVLSV